MENGVPTLVKWPEYNQSSDLKGLPESHTSLWQSNLLPNPVGTDAADFY